MSIAVSLNGATGKGCPITACGIRNKAFVESLISESLPVCCIVSSGLNMLFRFAKVRRPDDLAKNDEGGPADKAYKRKLSTNESGRFVS